MASTPQLQVLMGSKRAAFPNDSTTEGNNTWRRWKPWKPQSSFWWVLYTTPLHTLFVLGTCDNLRPTQAKHSILRTSVLVVFFAFNIYSALFLKTVSFVNKPCKPWQGSGGTFWALHHARLNGYGYLTFLDYLKWLACFMSCSILPTKEVATQPRGEDSLCDQKRALELVMWIFSFWGEHFQKQERCSASESDAQHPQNGEYTGHKEQGTSESMWGKRLVVLKRCLFGRFWQNLATFWTFKLPCKSDYCKSAFGTSGVVMSVARVKLITCWKPNHLWKCHKWN